MGPKNVFAYRPAVLQPKDILPLPSSAAAENTIQGSMLLFKIPVANFQNRPLVLEIPPPHGNGPTGSVDLDVYEGRDRPQGVPVARGGTARAGSPPSRGVWPRSRPPSALEAQPVAFRPASMTSRAAGAAVSPPAPEPTRSTPTATCGRPVPAGA